MSLLLRINAGANFNLGWGGAQHARTCDVIAFNFTMAALGLLCGLLLAATVRCSVELGQVPLVLNVTKEGHNTHECLQGRSNCSSIGYALAGIPASGSAFTETIINVYYGHSFSNGSGIRLWQVENVSILGHGSPVINCSDLGVGISFNGSAGIYIGGIYWKNCSISHPTTAFLRSHPQLSFLHAYSALFFYNCSCVTVSGCQFSSQRGSGISMFDVRGEVVIEHSDFLNHSVSAVGECQKTHGTHTDNATCSPQAVGVHIQFTFCGDFVVCLSSDRTVLNNSNYSISHCRFEGNHNPRAYGAKPARQIPLGDSLEHWPFGRGGGLYVDLRAHDMGNNLFAISNCNFLGNSALWGGGMFVKIISYELFGNEIAISDCHFFGNQAHFSGGGIRLGMILSGDSDNIMHQCCNSIMLNAVEFVNNTAYWGGGISIYNNPTRIPVFSVNMIGSVWRNNTALNSAAAVGLTKWVSGMVTNASTMSAIFYNCHFTENRLEIPIGVNSKLYGFGTVYTEGIPLEFHGNTRFYQNFESALYISSTSVRFHDNICFKENVGLLGGGLYLTGTAWITLYKGVNILFEGNTVFQYGGALYYTFPPSLSLRDSNGCFLTYVDPSSTHSVPLENWQVNVTFKNNLATQAGDAVYVSNPVECTWEQGGNPFNVSHPDKFVYLQNMSRSVIATPAYKLRFQSPGVTISEDGWYTYSVMPGEAFDLSVELLDFYDQSSGTTILSVRCHNVTKYKEYNFHDDLCDDSTVYDLHGVRVFTSNTTLSKFSVSGPHNRDASNNSEFILVFKTDTAWPILAPLKIEFQPCRLGMVYDPNTNECVCKKSRYITCVRNDEDRTTPCIKAGYWYGNVSVTSEIIYGVQLCLAASGACSHQFHHCDDFPNMYEIPVNESVSCIEGWTGPLCSRCREGLQLGYDYYRCRKCTVGSKVGLVLLIVQYWIFVVLEIVVLLHLNVSAVSAGFYCFLYFYSVIRYYVVAFPYNLDPVISLLVSFTQLDPKYLAFTGFCLFDSVTPIQYEFLHFIHPVAISVLLYVLSRIDLHCHFKFKFLSGQGAIPAVSIFLLISFTSLAETCANILNPLLYVDTYPDRYIVVVAIQASTPYMHRTQHLPYAIIAILVACILVIPFTLFMLLAPWLAQCFNLVRFKPILDEYQGCYKNEYRWFAGLYLLARQFMYVTSPTSIGLDLATYLQQLISVLLLTLHATVQPYKTESKWLNRVDTLLLLDLTLLSLNVGSTAANSFYGSPNVRHSLMVVMALFPCLLVLVAISFQVYKKVWSYCRRQHMGAPLLSPIETAPSSDAESEADLPPLRGESGKWIHSWAEIESRPLLPAASKHSQSSRGQAGASVDTPGAAGSIQKEAKVCSDSKMLLAKPTSSVAAAGSRTTL